MDKEEIMTLKEACNFLKISEITMRRWLKAGSIPAHKSGRHWRFIKSELIEWLRKR